MVFPNALPLGRAFVSPGSVVGNTGVDGSRHRLDALVTGLAARRLKREPLELGWTKCPVDQSFFSSVVSKPVCPCRDFVRFTAQVPQLPGLPSDSSPSR